MKKHLLSFLLALMFTGASWADDTQTVTIDGAAAGKTVKQITFNGDKIILHFTDNTTYEGEDLSLVVITFNNASGISKTSQTLDTGNHMVRPLGPSPPGCSHPKRHLHQEIRN